PGDPGFARRGFYGPFGGILEGEECRRILWVEPAGERLADARRLRRMEPAGRFLVDPGDQTVGVDGDQGPSVRFRKRVRFPKRENQLTPGALKQHAGLTGLGG